MKKHTLQVSMSKAYGDFFKDHQEWDFFLTMTPSLYRSQAACRGLAQKVITRLSAGAIWVTERNPDKRGYHVHALLKTEHDIHEVQTVIRTELKGMRHIVPYNREKGAAYYITKDIFKNRVDWDIQENE